MIIIKSTKTFVEMHTCLYGTWVIANFLTLYQSLGIPILNFFQGHLNVANLLYLVQFLAILQRVHAWLFEYLIL